ncbi:MAG: hypothetical protein QNJ12_18560 [Ilumatobacter sp.]|uniref:hypothetical protein n=1 Tax=Ilumatobacter sp. TaxID=1967498 RepID=UPI002627A2CB|nr:hypothetical protein [Ilumatobacter sp.]MDJ0770803.1 hypothetical protein [Ilumatobacter sp.]
MFRRLLPLAFAGILVACGGTSDDASTPSAADDVAETAAPAAPATTAAADEAGAVVPAGDVPEALQFSASLVGGGDIDVAALAGRPVLLWFWAPW